MIPFPYRAANFAGSFPPTVVPGGDPNYANVSLLLHCDGTNGSTTFTDNSPSPRTMTALGNAQVSTAQFKFGTGSMLLDGAGDYVETPSNAVFNMGTGAFTIEGWIRVAATGARAGIIGQANSAGQNSSVSFYIERTAANKIQAFCCNSTTTIGDITGATTIAINTWYHIAYVRNGNNFNLYVNGTSDASTVTSSLALNSSVNNLAIGRLGEFNGLYYNGYIDDVRVTKGVARYTGNFTPPTAAFPDF